VLPPGACDCHVHVVGDAPPTPWWPTGTTRPGRRRTTLLRTLARNGLERAVIVQPSFYGTDNRCMLDSLDGLQGRGRGIAVVDDDVGDASLADLHAAASAACA
jgi:predicted TIM-barrel fold metal-dependent hydrolase